MDRMSAVLLIIQPLAALWWLWAVPGVGAADLKPGYWAVNGHGQSRGLPSHGGGPRTVCTILSTFGFELEVIQAGTVAPSYLGWSTWWAGGKWQVLISVVCLSLDSKAQA